MATDSNGRVLRVLRELLETAADLQKAGLLPESDLAKLERLQKLLQ